MTRGFNCFPVHFLDRAVCLTRVLEPHIIPKPGTSWFTKGWPGAEQISWAIYSTTTSSFCHANYFSLKQDFMPVLSLVGSICQTRAANLHSNFRQWSSYLRKQSSFSYSKWRRGNACRGIACPSNVNTQIQAERLFPWTPLKYLTLSTCTSMKTV